jgi:LacI family transcriptional regulator
MMEHLWSLGHRKIAVIYFPDQAPELKTDPRELGVRQFFTKMGKPCEESLLCKIDSNSVGLHAALERCLKKGATAVFAGNDVIATRIIRWAYEQGLRIPDDLSVAGFGDSPLAASVVPTLTTMRSPLDELASKTVAALIHRIDGKEIQQQEILSMQLIVRESTQFIKSKK